MTKTEVLLLAQARRLAATGHGGEVRRRQSLSLREVADCIGCGVTTLWRWERGERAPQGAPAVAWAQLVSALDESKVGAA
jgi:DNA-binding transcriptional regulator YiaG